MTLCVKKKRENLLIQANLKVYENKTSSSSFQKKTLSGNKKKTYQMCLDWHRRQTYLSLPVSDALGCLILNSRSRMIKNCYYHRKCIPDSWWLHGESLDKHWILCITVFEYTLWIDAIQENNSATLIFKKLLLRNASININ